MKNSVLSSRVKKSDSDKALPVEYDASNRALAWLKNKHMLSQQEYKGAEDALKWAARTYLVAALGSLATLVYWGFQIFGRD